MAIREYLGGCVVSRTTDLSNVNMTGARYLINWQQADFDLPGPEARRPWWDAGTPSRLVVPPLRWAKRVVCRLGFSASWDDVGIGTDWCTYVVRQNGVEIHDYLHPGGFEVVNPILGFTTKQVLATPGDYFEALVQWRNTETSVDFKAQAHTHFEVQVLGYVY